MRRGTTRALVAGWAVLAVAGWTTAQWLGEVTATSGPAPVTPPSSTAEPGPQPEYDCDELMASARRSPGVPETAKRPPAVPESSPEGQPRARLVQVVCDTAEFTTEAEE
ncbi:hypothetical protein [Streptomyces sp. NPDC001515]